MYKQKEKINTTVSLSAYKNISYDTYTLSSFSELSGKINTEIDPQVKEASNAFYSLLSCQYPNDSSKSETYI